MAILYRAQLVPSKIDLLRDWVPGQPWLGGADVSALEVVDAFRFDDPAGEVGIETILLAAGGQVLQAPVTYRDAPLAGAEASLLGTAEHSVLGRRWVYDGCGDPVYKRALAAAILAGGREADLEVQTETGPVLREPTARVQGSGDPGATVPDFGASVRFDRDATTVLEQGGVELVLVRVLDVAPAGAAAAVGAAVVGSATLTGTWPGRDRPALLAFTRAPR